MEQTKSEESSVETATEAPSRRRTNRRRTVQPAATQRKRRRRIVIGTASAAAVAVAWGGYVAYEATQIKLNLEEAAEFATQTKDALLAGNSEEAVRSADDAARYAGRAKDATDSVSWRIAAAIPGIGGPFDTTRQISDVVQGLASDVLRPAVEAGSALSPDQLLLDGARIDLTGLRDAAPVLAETAAAADELAVRASEIDSTFVSQIDGPRQDSWGRPRTCRHCSATYRPRRRSRPRCSAPMGPAATSSDSRPTPRLAEPADSSEGSANCTR